MSTSPPVGATPTVAHTIPNTNVDNSEVQHTPTPLLAAKIPVGPGVVSVVGLILALLVIAIGVVAVHDALVAAGAANGTPWIDAATAALNGLTPAFWLVPVGVTLAFIGLWLLLTAVRPRPRKGIALQAKTGVFLRPRDVATLARSAAQEVDGVTSAKVTVSRRKIAVAARTTNGGTEQDITQAVLTRLRALAMAPTVRVTVKTEGN